MAKYIEREVLLKKLHEAGGCGAEPNTWADGYDKAIDHAYGIAQKIPAADVAPVRRGHWKANYEYEDFIDADCSECGKRSDFMYKYCPYCGAKMDGGADNG